MFKSKLGKVYTLKSGAWIRLKWERSRGGSRGPKIRQLSRIGVSVKSFVAYTDAVFSSTSGNDPGVCLQLWGEPKIEGLRELFDFVQPWFMETFLRGMLRERLLW